MAESLADQIAKLPDVDESAPTLILSDPKTLIIVYGIDYKRFNALSQGFIFRAGRPFQAPDEALADDIVAQTRHIKVGDTVSLINHPFTISGIVAHGKGARFFIPLKTGQDIVGAENRISMVFVRSKGDTEAARAEIRHRAHRERRLGSAGGAHRARARPFVPGCDRDDEPGRDRMLDGVRDDVRPVGGAQLHADAFVVGTGCGQVGRTEATRPMLHGNHFAAHRGSLDVGVQQRQEDAHPRQLRVAQAELGGRGCGIDDADQPVGGCDDDAGPVGRYPGRVPEKPGTGAGGQQAGPAQPPVAAPGHSHSQPAGNERQPGRMHRWNRRTQQRQQALRSGRLVFAGRTGTSCHAVILRSRGRCQTG